METPMAPAMPCKASKKGKHGASRGKSKKNKSKLACIFGSQWIHKTAYGRVFTELPWGSYCSKRGQLTATLKNCYTNLFLCIKQWRYPQQKQQWIKNGRNLKRLLRGTWQKSEFKSEVVDEARTKGAEVHFASLMDICHLKNAELETKHQKYKGRVVVRGDIVKDDSGSYAVFTEQGSSASQMLQLKSWISYLHCQDAQDKQRTQYLLKPR